MRRAPSTLAVATLAGESQEPSSSRTAPVSGELPHIGDLSKKYGKAAQNPSASAHGAEK